MERIPFILNLTQKVLQTLKSCLLTSPRNPQGANKTAPIWGVGNPSSRCPSPSLKHRTQIWVWIWKKPWLFMDTNPPKKTSKNHQKKIFSIHPCLTTSCSIFVVYFLLGWWCVPPVNNPFRSNKQTGSKDPMPGWLIGAVPPVQFFAWYLRVTSSKGYEKGPGLYKW